MNLNLLKYILIGIVLVGFFIFLIIWGVMVDKQQKADKNKVTKSIEDSLEEEFEELKVNAKVIDMYCSSELIGIKRPKAVEVYSLSFEANDGKLFKLNVPKEMYDGVEIGQTGILTLMDGELYSFELD